MKYVLDTDVFSALMRGDARAIDRLASAKRTDVAVPQPVLAEIAYGIERLSSSARRESLQQRFDLLRSQLSRREWTDEVSEAFGRMKAVLEKKGKRLEDFDIAIAAHAVATGSTLATGNTQHMARIPELRIENWLA